MSTANPEAFQQMLAQLRNDFLEDMPGKLDVLENMLLSMESSGVSSERFNEFYRVIHSLKGSGGTFGLHIITTICHQLEDVLNATEGGTKYTPELLAASLNYIDLLRLALEQILAYSASFIQIEDKLIQLREKLTPKKFNVLIIDDSKLLTQIYLQSLAGLPIRTVIVNDGYIALMRALTEPFDLIITTNEIPVLNGIALIGAVKLSGYRNHRTPTVLVTSNEKITEHIHRNTDANRIIVRNSQLPENLHNYAKQVLVQTK